MTGSDTMSASDVFQMESLACLKDHLELTMSENECLMAAVDEFASSLKSKSSGPSRQSSVALARQTDFFREQMKLLNRRIHENIAGIDAVVSRSVPRDAADGSEDTLECVSLAGGTLERNRVTDCSEDTLECRDRGSREVVTEKTQMDDTVTLDGRRRRRRRSRSGGKTASREEEVALRMCRLDDAGGKDLDPATVEDLRRATVLEAVEFLCEDEADKRRILKHLKETDDECSLRMLEGVICKKYVEVRLLQEDMGQQERRTLTTRLAEDRWDDLPIIRGEILYLMDDFDVEVEKFRVTVSEIAKVQCALHEKNLEIHGIQQRLMAGKGKVTGKSKVTVSYKDVEAEFRSKYGGGGGEVSSLLRAAKERNVRLQGLINDQSLKIRAMVAELGQVGAADREEIETELLKVVKELHGAMEVVNTKSEEAVQRQHETLRKLEELHESQEDLLKVLAVICDNLDAGDEAEGEGKLDELRGEIEYLESEFRVKNARTLDLIDRYQGVLTDVATQVACRADACVSHTHGGGGGGFASFRRRIAVLAEETISCKRGLLECIKQQEYSDGAVRKLRRLVMDEPSGRVPEVVSGRGARLSCVMENQDLQMELLERKLVDVVERSARMTSDADHMLVEKTRQVEALGARLAEAECRLEKNKDVLEAVDFAEDLDLEKILADTVKKARARLGVVVQRLDTCSLRVAELVDKTEAVARRGLLRDAVDVLEVQQLFVNKKAHEFFAERKDNLYQQIVNKSSEFEKIHRELDEIRRAKVRLEGRGRGDVEELQRLLHEIKELKLQMLLNSTLEKNVHVQPVGDVGQLLGHAEKQKELLDSVAQSREDFEVYVSLVKDNLVHLQEELQATRLEVMDILENLVQIILDGGGEEEDDGAGASEPEVADEVVVKDLVTKILEGRVDKWQSGQMFQRSTECPDSCGTVLREASVSRVETWQRGGGGNDQDYCHKVLEMCLKVDVMQDDILSRLESVSRERPAPPRRPGTRRINTEGLAAATLLPPQSSRSRSRGGDVVGKQLAKCARQNTVLKALLKDSLTRTAIYQEALAKTRVSNVDALPRHKWLKENVLLRDLVAQLMDEVFVLQTRVAVTSR